MSAKAMRCTIVLISCACFPIYLRAQPGRNCNASRTFDRANTLLKLRRYAETSAILTELRSCPNLSPLATFNLGWLYGRSQDFRTALEIFRSLNVDVPDEITHQYAVALAEFELGDFTKSVATLKGLQAERALDPKCANLLAVADSKLGLYQDAYATLTETLKSNPSDLFSYLNLITLFADTGHFESAAEIASQAIAVFPENSDVFVARGAVYVLTGELDKAQSDFATAVHLSPRQASPRFLLALSEYKKGDFDASSASLRAAMKSGIVDSDLHYLLAECILRTDPAQRAHAVAELNQAIALNPKSVAGRTLRGRLQLQAGQVGEAVQDLALAHRLDPTSRSAAYNLARADWKLGKTKDAEALFQRLQNQTGDSLSELSDQKIHKALAAGGISH
jgi:tetratricopeptide (TPR) repeat protein